MDPDKIELKNLTKSFEYTKIASEIDSCDDRDMLRSIAKSLSNFIISNKRLCQ